VRRMCFILTILLVLCVPALAQAQGKYDDGAPDEDLVFVEGYQPEGGVAVQGFYRPRARPGTKWVRGHFDAAKWVAPHFRPVRKKAGSTWVRGHRGPDGFWVSGHWRKVNQPGHRWVAGRLTAGRWRHGHWRPAAKKANHIWVGGYSSPRGNWMVGHWRPAKRAGHRWVAGHWRYGRWIAGHWVPRTKRSGKVWVPGHWRKGRWVAGHWRIAKRPGHHWARGHWGPNGWVRGHWRPGAVQRAQRRHKRIERVRHRTTGKKPKLIRRPKR